MNGSIIGLVGVALGAAITLAGEFVRDSVGRNKENRDMLRAKAEEIYERCCEVDDWCGKYGIWVYLATHQNIMDLSGQKPLSKDPPEGMPPMDRLDALVTIYHPELQLHCSKVKFAEKTFVDGCRVYSRGTKADAEYEQNVKLPLSELHKACGELKSEACILARSRYL